MTDTDKNQVNSNMDPDDHSVEAISYRPTTQSLEVRGKEGDHISFTRQMLPSTNTENERRPAAAIPVDRNKPIFFGFVLCILLIVGFYLSLNLDRVLDFKLHAMDRSIVSDAKYMDEQRVKNEQQKRYEAYMYTPQKITTRVCKPLWLFFQTCEIREEYNIPAEKIGLTGVQKEEAKPLLTSTAPEEQKDSNEEEEEILVKNEL